MKSIPAEDPMTLVGRALTKAKTAWMRAVYPFAGLGRGASLHYTCDLRRSVSNRISIGSCVYIAPHVWLNIPEFVPGAAPAIVLEDGCLIGRRCMITARNLVHLERDVMLGPSVLIADHGHEFSNPDEPIHQQGLTSGGTVKIERNCWLGYGAAVIGRSGDLVIGRNSIIGANAVVTFSIPPYSLVVGNPGRIARRYNPAVGDWSRVAQG